MTNEALTRTSRPIEFGDNRQVVRMDPHTVDLGTVMTKAVAADDLGAFETWSEAWTDVYVVNGTPVGGTDRVYGNLESAARALHGVDERHLP